MGRMRRAPWAFAVMVIAGVGGAGCGPDLPDRYWRSDNVRYFSRSDDDAVCPAILDELEAHGQAIADALMIGRTTVTYYKFRDQQDFDAHFDCDPNGPACATNATAFTPVDFDRHELIHAYLGPYGEPPWLLSEGAAVALSCQRFPRPSGSWRDAYARAHTDQALYAAGGWLVGYLLQRFPARLFPRLYNRLAINATADELAKAFTDVYCTDPMSCIDLDAVWAAAIGGEEQPMRCPWECPTTGAEQRAAFVVDGQPHPLIPVCAGGTLQRSVAVPGAGLSRWRVEGAGRFELRSCNGTETSLTSVPGTSGPGELIEPLAGGAYFVEAEVETGGAPFLTATVTPGEGLSWSDCAAAPVLPDDLGSLSTLALFYPRSATPQFTRFGTGRDHGGLLLLNTYDLAVTASLCASCDPQTCVMTDNASGALATYAMPPGAVLSVPPAAAAVTATFY
jgi:hypothetical protein